MKRMYIALAVAAVATAGTARADWNGYGPVGAGPGPAPVGYPGGAPGGYPGPGGGGEFTSPNTLSGYMASGSNKAPDRYGLLPGLRRVFRIGGSNECNTCGSAAGAGVGYGPGAGAPPVMQGTLVFPHHTYVRSPRDFFMYESGR